MEGYPYHSGHYSSTRVVCTKCNHNFESEDQLREHMPIHYSRSCGVCGYKPHSKLKQTSAVILHLESGRCRINETDLKEIILAFPEHTAITVDALRDDLRIVRNHLDRTRSASPCRSVDYGTTLYCYSCRRSFRAPEDLDQHLASPAHAPYAFQCPSKSCGIRFPLLSALFQHAENSNGCKEGLNSGSGCVGRLWGFVDEELHKISRARRIRGPYFRVEQDKRQGGMAKAAPSTGHMKVDPTGTEGRQVSTMSGRQCLPPTGPYLRGRGSSRVPASSASMVVPISTIGSMDEHGTPASLQDKAKSVENRESGRLSNHPPIIVCPKSPNIQASAKTIAAVPSVQSHYVVNGSGRLESWTGAASQANLPVFALIGISAPIDSFLPEEFDFGSADS